MTTNCHASQRDQSWCSSISLFYLFDTFKFYLIRCLFSLPHANYVHTRQDMLTHVDIYFIDKPTIPHSQHILALGLITFVSIAHAY